MSKFLGSVKLPSLSSAPSSPSAGQVYYNTTDNTGYIYDGTSWVDIGASGGGGGGLSYGQVSIF